MKKQQYPYECGGAWARIFHREADHEVPRPGFRSVPVWHEVDSLNYMIRADIAKKHLDKWRHEKGQPVTHDYNFAKACFDEAPWVFVDEALACHGQPTSVLVLAVCYNEEKLIPFFLRHYEPIADKIIVYDGGSTDCSLDLLRASPKVEIVSAPSAEMHNRDLMKIRNEAWKEYRDDYDWVIVCDMDEFLYHPQLSQRLDEYRIKLSVTVPKIIGYQMFAEKFPQDDGHSQIYDLVRNGFADPEHLNKSMIFYAKDVDINYDMGCHSAKPAGRVIYSQEPFYLLHYKYVGYDEFLERNRALAARVSEDDKANHWAYHYEEHAKMSREYFDLVGAKATDVFSAISGTGKKVEWENLKKQDKFTFWEIVERNQYKVYPSFFTNKNVLDVGANIGVFSLLARECGAKQILSVEPNPEALKMLVPNVEGRNIEVLEKAVAAKDGEHMKVVQKAGFVPHDGKTFTLPAEEGVETISLHTLLSHITDPNPIILKIDTEGAEYDFLYGTAPEDFNRIEHILIEMHQDGGSQVGKKNLINPLREYICSLGYQEMGMEIGVPDHAMIFRYDKMHPVVPPYHRPEVTVDICTKNRYYSTLPLTLMSVAMQSYPIRKIILVDDSDTEKDGKMKDLRNDPMYQYFFRLLQLKNIEWEVVFGPKKGQHHNHQIVMDKAKTELIWRIDDDESPEANALEELVKHMQPGVGCVGGLVLDPSNAKPSPTMYENRNKMAEIFSRENTQWVIQPPGQVFEVEHLYSSFLYRKVSDIGYDLSLSPVAHREETIFSHEYFRKGWKVLVTTDAKTWHFRNPQGGIRSTPNPELWEHDEKIFQRKLQSWAIKPEGKIFDIDAGIGDTICFKTILPDLLKKHKQLTIGTYYPTLFKDYPQIKILHPWAVKDILGHKVAELQNVYRHLWRESDRGRKLTLIEAYRELFIDEK